MPMPGVPTMVASRAVRSATACVVGGADGGELVPAADERRRNRPRECRHVRPQPDEPVGDERLGLALGVDGRRRLGVDEVGDGRVGRGAEQHLAGRGRLLEPGRDVDRVAGRELLVGCAPPPTTTSPVLMPVRVMISTPWSRSRSAFSSRSASWISAAARTARSGSSSRTAGHAEHGHDRVADELLHRAAVALERGLDGLEVPPHDVAEELRVEAFAECGRAGDVREEDGDDLARFRLDGHAVSLFPLKRWQSPGARASGRSFAAAGRRRRGRCRSASTRGCRPRADV